MQIKQKVILFKQLLSDGFWGTACMFLKKFIEVGRVFKTETEGNLRNIPIAVDKKCSCFFYYPVGYMLCCCFACYFFYGAVQMIYMNR